MTVSSGNMNMGIAERVYEVVKNLPEAIASEVLEYAERKRSLAANEDLTKERADGLALMDKHAGKFKMTNYTRDELYDRPSLR